MPHHYRSFLIFVVLACAIFIAQAQFLDHTAIVFVCSLFYLAFPAIIHFRESINMQITQTLYMGVCGVLVMMMPGWLMAFPSIMLCYVGVLIFVLQYIGYRFPQYYFANMVIGVVGVTAVVLIPTGQKMLHLSLVWLLAMGVVLIPQAIGVIGYRQRLRQSFTKQLVGHLRALNQGIIDCLLKTDYQQQIYLYERRLHQYKQACLSCLVRLRELRSKSTVLENSYDILLDSAQVRRRVVDHATFTICAEELRTIQGAIDVVLQTYLAGDEHPLQKHPVKLSHAIDRLEDSYHNILNVSAREPLVFLLYIFSLKEFNRVMVGEMSS